MKKSSELANHVLNAEIKQVTESIAHRLNVVLDSLTDANCKPLKGSNIKMVIELQDIALCLYQLNDETIPEAVEEIISTIEAGY